MKYYTKLNSPVGLIILVGDSDGLSELCFGKAELSRDCVENADFFIDTVKQLKEYFAGKRSEFKIKLNPQGTDFQKRVWRELIKIPYGETRSYGEIAKAIGRPGAARAVGMANSRNPLPVIIPCHRVIGADGTLTGFSSGLELKSQLLAVEK